MNSQEFPILKFKSIEYRLRRQSICLKKIILTLFIFQLQFSCNSIPQFGENGSCSREMNNGENIKIAKG